MVESGREKATAAHGGAGRASWRPLIGALAVAAGIAIFGSNNAGAADKQEIIIVDKGSKEIDVKPKNIGSHHSKDLEEVPESQKFDGLTNPTQLDYEEITLKIWRVQGSDCTITCRTLSSGDTTCWRKCK